MSTILAIKQRRKLSVSQVFLSASVSISYIFLPDYDAATYSLSVTYKNYVEIFNTLTLELFMTSSLPPLKRVFQDLLLTDANTIVKMSLFEKVSADEGFSSMFKTSSISHLPLGTTSLESTKSTLN